MSRRGLERTTVSPFMKVALKGVVVTLSAAVAAIALVAALVSSTYLRYFASRAPDPGRGVIYRDFFWYSDATGDATVYLTRNQFLLLSPGAYLLVSGAAGLLLSASLWGKIYTKSQMKRAGRKTNRSAGENLSTDVLQQL